MAVKRSKNRTINHKTVCKGISKNKCWSVGVATDNGPIILDRITAIRCFIIVTPLYQSNLGNTLLNYMPKAKIKRL